MNHFLALLFFVFAFPVEVLSLRVVSLSPVITEIICSINGQSSLVGVTTLCDTPTSVKSLPKIGDFTPNSEAILALEPDIVLGLGLGNPVKSRLQRLGLKVDMMDSPKSLRALFGLIYRVGRQIDRKEDAAKLVDSLRNKLQALPFNDSIEADRPKVLVALWVKPLISVGPNTFISDMIRLAGGENILRQSASDFPNISPEILLRDSPDFILCNHPSLKDALLKMSFVQASDIAKKNRIIDSIDPNLLSRAGPRIVDGIIAIHEAIYSDHE